MNPHNHDPGNALQPAARTPLGAALPSTQRDINLADYMDSPFGAGDEISIRRITVMLRKRKWLLIATTLVIVAATAIVSYRTTPVYEAAAITKIGRAHV